MSTDDDIALINDHFANDSADGTSVPASGTDSDIDLINKHFAEQDKATADAQSPPTTLDKIGMGLEHGTLSVPKTIGHEGADFIAKQLGATPEAISANDAKYAADEAAYQKRFGHSTIAAAAAIPGQVIAAAPYLGAAGEGLGVIGSKVPQIADAVGTNAVTRLAGKGIVGAAQGAGFNALTGDNVEEGAKTGAVVNGVAGPAIGKIYDLAANKLGPLLQPFTESGRNKIANNIVEGYKGAPLSLNASEIVPGSKPTLAEASGDPGIAQLQDALYQRNSSPFALRTAENNSARTNLLSDVSGTSQDIEAASLQRSANAKTALGDPRNNIPSALFATAKPVEPAEVLDTIDKVLKGNSGNRPAVVQSMQAVKSMMQDADGNPITDPARLYHSVRKGIDDLLDKKNLTNPAGKQAAAELGQVQDSLDNAIEKGAPGFKKYLSDYSQASSPIDAMKWMQKLNLKDAQGDLTLAKVQNALQNVNKLQNTPGISPAKNLSQDQIAALRNIRDDLLRQSNLGAGKSFGSQTAQRAIAQDRLNSVLSGSSSENLLKKTIGSGAGAILGSFLGPPAAAIGAMVGNQLAGKLSGALASKNDLIRQKIQEIMLDPSKYSPGGMAAAPSANILNNPALHYGLVPTGNAIVNSF